MLTLIAVATALSGSVVVSQSEVEISPPEALPLGGYTDRKGKVMDVGGEPLYCRTLVIRKGALTIALSSVEMLTVPESLHREVKKRLPSEVRLFLAATHTHSAPDSQMLNERMTLSVPGIASFKRKWLDWYADRIALGIRRALGSPGESYSGLMAQTWTSDLNRPRRTGAEPSKRAAQVGFFSGDEEPGPGFYHYAAHPVFYGPEHNLTGGDWPGALAPTGSLVLLGPIGGVSPYAEGSTPAERVANFVKTFRADSQRGRAQRFPADKVGWAEAVIALGPKTPHPGFASAYKVPEAFGQAIIKQFAPDTGQVSAFRVGKVAVVGVPGEPSPELGRQIQNEGFRLGFAHTLVTSHVNGWVGYLLEPSDYDRGGYEATLSFHGREAGTRLVEAGKSALRELARAKH